jgi:hypothetical protein
MGSEGMFPGSRSKPNDGRRDGGCRRRDETQEGFTDYADGRGIPRTQSPQTAFTELHPARDVSRPFRQTRDEGDPAVVMESASPDL